MLTSIRLQNFRSYKDSSFELSPSVNIIVGPNASGKTNLLEAILVLSQGGSYRASDLELIKFNKHWARIDGQTNQNDQLTIKLTRHPTISKTRYINAKAYARLPAEKNLPVVIFEPNHLQLVWGGPDKRRDYLDVLLAKLIPGYDQTLRSYKRALAQRNRLLKVRPHNLPKLIFPWDVKLSQLGGQIARHRIGLSDQLNSQINQLYKLISDSNTTVKVEYTSRWCPASYETKLFSHLEDHLNEDSQKGFTSFGPHREDLKLLFNDASASDSASRGEMRSSVLALKMFELSALREKLGVNPILLLDDVFSELDNKRRKALAQYTASFQTFITTVDADAALANYRTERNIIPIKAAKD